MNTYEQIVADRKQARLNKDIATVTSLGTLLGDIQNKWSAIPVTTRGSRDSIPEDTITWSVVKSSATFLTELLKVKDSEEGRTELELLKTYLPQPLTDQQLKDIVEECLKYYTPDLGNKIKYVMDYLKSSYAGLYDGGKVRTLIN